VCIRRCGGCEGDAALNNGRCCGGGGGRIRDRNNRPGPPALNYSNVGINMIGFSLLLLVTDCSLVMRRDTRLLNNSPVPATEAILYTVHVLIIYIIIYRLNMISISIYIYIYIYVPRGGDDDGTFLR